jgi:Mor family transcriptional regulator
MKEKTAQQNLDFIEHNPLENMANLILRAKEDMNNIGQRIKSQGALLKETLDTLNEIQATVFDMRQGELFNDESTETFEQLREIIGDEQASKVAKTFAGTMVYIPKNIIARNIHKKIKKKFWSGATYKELSRKYGYTERYIRNLVDRKEERQDGRNQRITK